MEYRPFGQTGLEVSAIGFGCWEVGRGYGQVEDAALARAVGRALELRSEPPAARAPAVSTALVGCRTVITTTPEYWIEDA